MACHSFQESSGILRNSWFLFRDVARDKRKKSSPRPWRSHHREKAVLVVNSIGFLSNIFAWGHIVWNHRNLQGCPGGGCHLLVCHFYLVFLLLTNAQWHQMQQGRLVDHWILKMSKMHRGSQTFKQDCTRNYENQNKRTKSSVMALTE